MEDAPVDRIGSHGRGAVRHPPEGMMDNAPVDSAVLHFADVRLEIFSCRVFRRDREVRLSLRNFRLLRFFLEHPRQALSRQQLIAVLWGMHSGMKERAVDVRITGLRRVLNAGGEENLIQTVRGVGYRLDDGVAKESPVR